MSGDAERRPSLSEAKFSAAAIEGWCVEHIARTLGIPPSEVEREKEVERLGLDSAALVVLVVELEEWLGVELTPQLLFEYPTIAELARHIAEEHAAAAAGRAGAP